MVSFLITNQQTPVPSGKIIYRPKGEALEYADLATNPYRGCGHGCTYCYAPAVLRMSRQEFDAGANAREDFLAKLKRDAGNLAEAGVRNTQVLLSFTTDPYHPGDTNLTRETMEVLKSYGLAFSILSKGGQRALRDIDLYRRTRDCYATTLTCLDDKTSRRWEPDAASPQDACLS